MKEFLTATAGMTPAERGAHLEGADEIGEAHAASAQEGQTEAPDEEEAAKCALHFIAFVRVDGRVLEMDGRKQTPIDHGATTEATFLADAAKACQTFMARDPDAHNFNIVSLCQVPAE